jgi:hypothetical protein
VCRRRRGEQRYIFVEECSFAEKEIAFFYMYCLFHSVSSGFQDSAKSVLFIAWYCFRRYFFRTENETNPDVSVEKSGSNALIGFQDVNWMLCPGKPLIVIISVPVQLMIQTCVLLPFLCQRWDPFSSCGSGLYLRRPAIVNSYSRNTEQVCLAVTLYIPTSAGTPVLTQAIPGFPHSLQTNAVMYLD